MIGYNQFRFESRPRGIIVVPSRPVQPQRIIGIPEKPSLTIHEYEKELPYIFKGWRILRLRGNVVMPIPPRCRLPWWVRRWLR